MPAANTHNNLILITGPRTHTRQRMFDLLIANALHHPVRVLLGGNYFPVYQITYALAAQTGNYHTILQNDITLSRTETGYQLTELLRQTENIPTPTLIIDLLPPLMDDSLNEKEANELLFESILELRRLARTGKVYLSAHTPQPRPRLLMALSKAAGEIWQPEPTIPTPTPQPGYWA